MCLLVDDIPGYCQVLPVFVDPRVPAFEGAPLYQDAKPTDSSQTSDSPTRKTEGEGEPGMASEEEQRQPASGEAARGTPPKQFPVVVFSHGLSAMRTIYSGICCDITSHGYVVAAVEHRL